MGKVRPDPPHSIYVLPADSGCSPNLAGRPICSCELSLDWRVGVAGPDHVMGVEAGLEPPQPAVGVLGPQCGPQPRSEPGRPSAGAALFRCPATGVARPANDAGFPPDHAAWSAAVPATPNGRRYGGFASRPPQATYNAQAIRLPSRPCEHGELERGPHRNHLPAGQQLTSTAPGRPASRAA
jgi:hypothetical protein